MQQKNPLTSRATDAEVEDEIKMWLRAGVLKLFQSLDPFTNHVTFADP